MVERPFWRIEREVMEYWGKVCDAVQGKQNLVRWGKEKVRCGCARQSGRHGMAWLGMVWMVGARVQGGTAEGTAVLGKDTAQPKFSPSGQGQQRRQQQGRQR